jgi:hypothetical protein
MPDLMGSSVPLLLREQDDDHSAHQVLGRLAGE